MAIKLILYIYFDKTFNFLEDWKIALAKSKYGGMVLDDDYVEGAASSIAHDMMISSNKKSSCNGSRA